MIALSLWFVGAAIFGVGVMLSIAVLGGLSKIANEVRECALPLRDIAKRTAHDPIS